LLGVAKGLFDLFPERFNEDGTEFETCHDIAGVKTWDTFAAGVAGVADSSGTCYAVV